MVFWFSLSLTFAAMYALLGLQIAFSSEYVVQDDARQHVFWMRRFLDPELFPNDLIADYFQSVAPLGYTTVYKLFALLGIDPILLSKFLPIVLGLITTGYCFGVCLQMLPVPMAGFLATLLLNQYLWLRDDIVSGTPVAFVYPLFVAFLYYLLRRSLVPMCVAIALLGLFYPQCIFICAGILILQMVHWKGGRPYLSQNRRDYWFCGAGLGVAVLVISFYALKSSQYGPVITAAEAKTSPEFLQEGLSQFFVDIPQHFWFTGLRTGIMPKFETIVPIVAGFLLLLLLPVASLFPLLKRMTQQVALLVQISLASLGMFFLAHALLFRLHLPSRYTEHSLRVVTAIAGGIALTVFLDAILLWARPKRQKAKDKTLEDRQKLALGFTALLLTALVLHPAFLKQFPKTEYIVGQVPPLYKFFAQQPKDIVIASLADEVTNLPTFAKRSILVGGRGFPVPYHKGYYAQIRQRTVDLIDAQYSPDLNQVQSFIQKYDVDFWLLEREAFTPSYISGSRWIRQYKPAADEAVARLAQGITPAITSVSDRCSVFQYGSFVVLQTKCILKS
jgi:hypothetical protein